MALHWPDVLTVYRKEITAAFRDRHTVIYTVLVPIFLYPLMFWGMGQVILLQKGQEERTVSKIALIGTEALPELAGRIRGMERIEIIPSTDYQADLRRRAIDAAVVIQQTEEDRRRVGGSEDRRVRAESLDAPTLQRSDPLTSYVTVETLFDQAEDASARARERLEEVYRRYQEDLLTRAATDAGLPEGSVHIFTVREVNVASPEKLGRFLLGMFLPMIMIAMAAMGALYPAIDAVVGERERKTLETTLVAATDRINLVVGKYLAVVTASMTAVALNLMSMMLTLKHVFTLFGEDAEALQLRLPMAAFPVILAGALLLSAFFCAVMLLLALFARTFKEGQSFVSPFYSLSFAPAIIAMLPGVELGPVTALIPVANAALLFKEAMSGVFRPGYILIVLVSLALYCTAPLLLARWLLRREDVLFGGHRGSLVGYLWRARRAAGGS